MTVQRLVVLLQGQPIGDIARNRDARLRFTYLDEWRSRPDATPLSTSLPLAAGSHDHKSVESFLWGLLPDNTAVLAAWGRRFQVSPRDAFSLLSTPVGEDCAGAVQLVPEERVDDVRDGGDVTWLTQDEVSAHLRLLRKDDTAWLPTWGGRFSLTGAQAKTALLYDAEGDRWGLPSGRVPTTHILKPAIRGLDDHDLNEHLCLEAARRLGLAAAESRVWQFGSQTAVVVRRYDRLRTADGWIRVHQEDLCQAFDVRPERKYQNEGGPSPAAVVRLLRDRVVPVEEADRTVWRFLDALALSWLIVGTDAHAKNYSLLLSGAQVRLAPLYDVASALPYGDDLERLRLAMKIGGTYRAHLIGPRHWGRVATEAGVSFEALRARLLELATALPDAMADASRNPDVRALRSRLTRMLVALVQEHSRRCARLLA